MKNDRSVKFNKLYDCLFCLILAVFPFVKIRLGYDFIDSGYSITNYLNFFRFKSGALLFTYLSNFAGYLFTLLPYGNTLLGIRFYSALLVSLTLMVCYLVLSRRYSKVIVFAGVVTAFFLTPGPYVVLYNYLTYLFIAIAVYLIDKALNDEKDICFLCAGIVLGLNVFVRISNLVFAILIVPVVVYLALQKENVSLIIKKILICIWGFLAGVLSVVIMICITYGGHVFKEMFDSLTSLSESGTGYAFSDMLLTLPSEILFYGKWLGLITVTILGAFAISLINARYKRNAIINIVTALISVAIILFILRRMSYWGIFTIHDYTDIESVHFFVLLSVIISIFVSVFTVCSGKIDKDDKFWAVTMIALITVIPLGTNTGMIAYQGNMFWILPITFGIMFKRAIGLKKSAKDLISSERIPVFVSVILLLAVTAFQSTMFYLNFVYANPAPGELSEKYDGGVLNGIYSVPGLNGIVKEAEDYIKKASLSGREVITWGDIPLMGFVLDMPTAFSTGWPDLTSFSEDTFVKELSTMDKPVIIVNRWFSGGDPLNPEVWQYSKKAELLSDFMNENDYRLTFENDKFRVYLAD